MKVRFDLSQNEITSTNISDNTEKNYFSQKMNSDKNIKSSSVTPKKGCLKVSSNINSVKNKNSSKGKHLT